MSFELAATLPNFFWSRSTGTFVNQRTGKVWPAGLIAYTGSDQEWNETLVETCVSLIVEVLKVDSTDVIKNLGFTLSINPIDAHLLVDTIGVKVYGFNIDITDDVLPGLVFVKDTSGTFGVVRILQ